MTGLGSVQCLAHFSVDNSRARAYCACSMCGLGCSDYVSLAYHPFSFSIYLEDGSI